MVEALTGTSGLFTVIRELVAAVVVWMGEIWTFITGNPILVVFVLALPLVGLCISFLNRIFKLN